MVAEKRINNWNSEKINNDMSKGASTFVREKPREERERQQED